MTDEFDGIPFVIGEPFEGLTHAEVLALPLPEAERYLVEDLIPAGAVGTIAGVPETHKSFLAQALAVRVAAGSGDVLGRAVRASGRVGYVWQDDSQREEVERVRLFERAHPSPAELSLWWFLNVGLTLPDDLARLRATVEQHRLDLLILDSFYSVAFGIDLKDAEAEQIVVLLKREIADSTGCTVLVVDHMPWPTDSNRRRLRGYGGVHKGAAIRFGIYIDAQDGKLHVEARGNNIKGFPKTPASWDAEALELRLVSPERVADDEHDERVLEYLHEHGWSVTETVRTEVVGNASAISQSLRRLETAGRVTSCSSRDLGRPGPGTYWNLASEAGLKVVPQAGTSQDDPVPKSVTNYPGRPLVLPPTGGRPGDGRPSDDLRDPVPHPGDPGFPKWLEGEYDAGHFDGLQAAELLWRHEVATKARQA